MGVWARAGRAPHSTAATARVAGSLQGLIVMNVLLEGGPLRAAARERWAFFLSNPAGAVKDPGGAVPLRAPLRLAPWRGRPAAPPPPGARRGWVPPWAL